MLATQGAPLGPRNLPHLTSLLGSPRRAPACWWPPRNTVPSGDVWVIPYQISPRDDTSQGTEELNPFSLCQRSREVGLLPNLEAQAFP